MYTVSNEIREKIANDLYNLMTDTNYDVDFYVVKRIVNMGIDMRCESGVYDILSSSPNWDPEKLCIIGKRGFERKFNSNAVSDFWWWMRDIHLKANTEVPMYDYGDITWALMFTRGSEYGNYWEQRKRLEAVHNFFGYVGGQFFNAELQEKIDELNKLNDNYKLRNNMKTSKAILKICREEGWDKLGGTYLNHDGQERNVFDQKFAELSDAINPITINMPFVLSGNPCDFFTQSWFTGHATSCHDTRDSDDPGCYSAGTTSYWLAPESLVFAKLDRNWGTGQNAWFDRKPWYAVEKEERQMIGISEGGVIIQSRLYPQNNDYNADDLYAEIREYVQALVANSLNEINSWETKKTIKEDELRDLVITTDEDSCAYEDWEPGCPGSQHVRISRLKSREWIPIRFAGRPICPSCGENMTCDEHAHILCDNCNDGRNKCGCCGYHYDSDDLEWCEDVEEYRCSNCRFWCEHCETYHGYYDEYEVVHNGRWTEYWCQRCVEEDAEYCEQCGEWHDRDDMYYLAYIDKFICPDCYENYAFQCSDCGDIFFNDEGHEVNGETYCGDCYADHCDEEEEA